MHEYGVTSAIISGLLDQLQREAVDRVLSIRFVRSSAFSEEVLRQTFDSLRTGTPLDGAELLINVSVLTVSCPDCGHSAVVTSSDLVGHMFICPKCGSVREIAEAHDLELVEVIAEAPETAPETGNG